MGNDRSAMLASKKDLTRGKSYTVRRAWEGCKEEVIPKVMCKNTGVFLRICRGRALKGSGGSLCQDLT